MRSPRPAWLVFAACALVVVAALGWTTAVVLRLERAEVRARADAVHRETLQRALWRMDSWMALFLAREAARPHTDYRIEAPSPSALATDAPPEYVLLHFRIDGSGRPSSPQLPEVAAFSPQSTPRRELLERLDPERIRAALRTAESLASSKLAESRPPVDAEPVLDARLEFEARVSCTVPPAPGTVRTGDVAANVGPLVPVWLGDTLAFVRAVHVESEEEYQGFLADWPALRERLLYEIRDLFPRADLVRVSSEPETVDPAVRGLANVPVALAAGAAQPPDPPGITPARTTLALAWLVTAIATAALGVTLHKSVELGERRRRFVSAVTHELRTPLTTFRMYSEMLADDLVDGDEKRREYLRTLRDESERLSAMVENVLDHARLEERRAPRRREELTLDALLERVTPPLVRRAEASGMTLEIERRTPGSAGLRVDAEAIGQVLRNLVDNAGKYAGNGIERTIRLRAAAENGSLTLAVRDHGPGIPPGESSVIFAPFERGGRDPSDPVPGIGLGLALARDLARDMGGDLTLESPGDGGACFVLRVPAG